MFLEIKILPQQPELSIKPECIDIIQPPALLKDIEVSENSP